MLFNIETPISSLDLPSNSYVSLDDNFICRNEMSFAQISTLFSTLESISKFDPRMSSTLDSLYKSPNTEALSLIFLNDSPEKTKEIALKSFILTNSKEEASLTAINHKYLPDEYKNKTQLYSFSFCKSSLKDEESFKITGKIFANEPEHIELVKQLEHSDFSFSE